MPGKDRFKQREVVLLAKQTAQFLQAALPRALAVVAYENRQDVSEVFHASAPHVKRFDGRNCSHATRGALSGPLHPGETRVEFFACEVRGRQFFQPILRGTKLFAKVATAWGGGAGGGQSLTEDSAESSDTRPLCRRKPAAGAQLDLSFAQWRKYTGDLSQRMIFLLRLMPADDRLEEAQQSPHRFQPFADFMDGFLQPARFIAADTTGGAQLIAHVAHQLVPGRQAGFCGGFHRATFYRNARCQCAESSRPGGAALTSRRSRAPAGCG